MSIAQKRLDKLIALLCGHSSASVRFFGINAACMTRIVSEDYPTMATDGRTLYVNPDWLDSHSDSEACFVLMHEAFHKVANHSIRLRDAAPQHKDLVHKAADYAVNLAMTLDKGIVYPMPDEGLINTDYADTDGRALNVERILAILLKDAQQQQQQQQQQDEDQQQGSGSGESDDQGQETDGQGSGESESNDSDERSTNGESFDSPEDGEGSGSEDTDETGAESGGSDETTADPLQSSSQETGDSQDDYFNDPDYAESDCGTGELLPAPEDMDASESMGDTAKAETIVGAGNLPDYLRVTIKDTLTTARSDWMAELRAELSKALDKSDYSMRIPSNRYASFGLISPSLRNPAIRKIAIVRDVSSSMSDAFDEISQQAKQIVDTFNPLETIVIDHNSRVVNRQSLTIGMPCRGLTKVGGGTSFQPVIDELEKETIDACLWLTDCMPMDRPKEPDFPVYYLSVDPFNRNYWDRYLKHGRYIDVA